MQASRGGVACCLNVAGDIATSSEEISLLGINVSERRLRRIPSQLYPIHSYYRLASFHPQTRPTTGKIRADSVHRPARPLPLASGARSDVTSAHLFYRPLVTIEYPASSEFKPSTRVRVCATISPSRIHHRVVCAEGTTARYCSISDVIAIPQSHVDCIAIVGRHLLNGFWSTPRRCGSVSRRTCPDRPGDGLESDRGAGTSIRQGMEEILDRLRSVALSWPSSNVSSWRLSDRCGSMFRKDEGEVDCEGTTILN